MLKGVKSMKLNFKVNKRNLSGLLALVMILSVFLMPFNVLAAEKKEPFHSTKKEDSYVQVVEVTLSNLSSSQFPILLVKEVIF